VTQISDARQSTEEDATEWYSPGILMTSGRRILPSIAMTAALALVAACTGRLVGERPDGDGDSGSSGDAAVAGSSGSSSGASAGSSGSSSGSAPGSSSGGSSSGGGSAGSGSSSGTTPGNGPDAGSGSGGACVAASSVTGIPTYTSVTQQSVCTMAQLQAAVSACIGSTGTTTPCDDWEAANPSCAACALGYQADGGVRADSAMYLEAIVQKRGIAIVPGAGDRGSDPRSLGRRGGQHVEAA
jgi:hypothetical protein